MVAYQLPIYDVNVRWLGYLALSVCINVMLAYNIQMGLPEFVPTQAQQIRVALKSMVMAKPKPAPIPTKLTQPVTKKVNKVKTVQHPVVTTTQAQEKIAVAKEVQEEKQVDMIDHEMVEAMPMVDEVASIKEASAMDIASPENTAAITTQNTSNLAEGLPVQPSANQQVKRHDDHVYQAKYRKKSPPDYPRRALELGQQGVVMLHAKVMPSGEPDEIKVVDSSGYRLLDKAALAAVKKWEFVPTNVNGQAIVSWVSVPVNFVIQ